MIHAIERHLGHHGAVIVRPASQYWVQQVDQIVLPYRLVATDNLLDLAIVRLLVLLARFDEHLSAVLTEIPAQEVETLVDVHDARLLHRQFEPSFFEEPFHPWLDLLLQQLLRATGDDEVISVPHHIYFESRSFRLAHPRT